MCVCTAPRASGRRQCIVYGGSSLGSMGRLAETAVVTLPGGCGTLEELFEAITWKRLGLYRGPVVLVNVNGFYDSCLALLARCVEEQFMDAKHSAMWQVAAGPETVVEILRGAPEWPADARSFAALR